MRQRLLLITLFLLFGALMAASFYRAPLSLFVWQHWQSEIAVWLNPNDPKLRFAIGNYFFGEGAYDLSKAEECFRSTLGLDPRFPGASYQLSRVYFIQGDFPRALAAINNELEHYSDYKRSYYIRGLIYGYMGVLDLAAEDFEEFLRWKPDSWAGHNDLAWVYFRQGAYEKALATAEAGLRANPDNVWLLNSRGVALLNLERPAEARLEFERALREAEAMTPLAWGAAYPGNHPEVYPQGLEAMRESIRRNLALLDEKQI